MSRWTHVAGSVRLDDLSFLLEERNTAKTVEKILGPMCLFEKWNEKSKIPRGSEGGIEYQIYTNKHDSSIARFSINFLGDLRDFDETDTVEIDKWFRKLLEEDIKDKKEYIKGEITEITPALAVIECNGIGIGIEIAEVCHHDTRGVSDLSVRLGKLLEDVIRNADVNLIVARCDPEADEVCAVLFCKAGVI